jgi:hypothetical protein
MKTIIYKTVNGVLNADGALIDSKIEHKLAILDLEDLMFLIKNQKGNSD